MNDELLILITLLGFTQFEDSSHSTSCEYGNDMSQDPSNQHWLALNKSGTFNVYAPMFVDEDGEEHSGKLFDTKDIQLVISYFKEVYPTYENI